MVSGVNPTSRKSVGDLDGLADSRTGAARSPRRACFDDVAATVTLPVACANSPRSSRTRPAYCFHPSRRNRPSPGSTPTIAQAVSPGDLTRFSPRPGYLETPNSGSVRLRDTARVESEAAQASPTRASSFPTPRTDTSIAPTEPGDRARTGPHHSDASAGRPEHTLGPHSGQAVPALLGPPPTRRGPEPTPVTGRSPVKKLFRAAAVLTAAWATGCRTCCDDHPSRSHRPGPPPVVTPPPPWVPDRPG